MPMTRAIQIGEEIDRGKNLNNDPRRAIGRKSRGQEGRFPICVFIRDISGDAEQEYFSDGISEDSITDLSKVSACKCLAHTASPSRANR